MERRITFGLFALALYWNDMETLLEGRQEEIVERAKRIMDIDLPIAEIDPMRATEFPKYLRYSFVGLLVSFIEIQLEAVCEEIGERLNLPPGDRYQELKARNPRPTVMERSKGFLRKHLDQTRPKVNRLPWVKIQFLFRLRHCVLHAGGNLAKIKRAGDRNELTKASGKIDGYSVKAGIVTLERRFGKKGALDVAFDFFKNLCSMMPAAKAHSEVD